MYGSRSQTFYIFLLCASSITCVPWQTNLALCVLPFRFFHHRWHRALAQGITPGTTGVAEPVYCIPSRTYLFRPVKGSVSVTCSAVGPVTTHSHPLPTCLGLNSRCFIPPLACWFVPPRFHPWGFKEPNQGLNLYRCFQNTPEWEK